MGKNTFKDLLLVCDMDGTLLDSRSKISKDNIRAAERFVQGGGLFTIATGRMEYAIKRYTEQLPINAPVILYNGAVICDMKSGKQIWQRFLPYNAFDVVKELSIKFPELGIEIFQGGNVYIINRNEETEKHQTRESFSPIFAPIEEVPDQWYKVILAWDPKYLKVIEEFLKGKLNNFYSVYSEPQFLELLGMDTSKGRALHNLARILGVKQKNIIAVGDNMNDLDMIKYAGIGVAVDNAHEELKKAAAICGAHHDDHVVKYIIRLIEDKNIFNNYRYLSM